MQSIEAGKPRALTPDGVIDCNVSPSGQILALTEDCRGLLYQSESSERPEKEFKFKPGEWPATWTSDSKFLYLVEMLNTPVTITRFEIATGRRTLWKQLPQLGQGIYMKGLVITPDGQSYAYTYSNHSSDLYVVSGLR